MKSMSRKLVCLSVVSMLVLSPAIAALAPVSGRRFADQTASDQDSWQRVDLRPARRALQRAPQIKVAIETKGPSMQGLIRIPGGLASNFNTGRGLTVVDLINSGDETRGYAEIVAIEIAFTQATRGQVFRISAAGE